MLKVLFIHLFLFIYFNQSVTIKNGVRAVSSMLGATPYRRDSWDAMAKTGIALGSSDPSGTSMLLISRTSVYIPIHTPCYYLTFKINNSCS